MGQVLEIPGAPADVGPDWVNAALGDHDHFQGSRVSGVSSEVIGDGAGFQAQVVRLHLSYERSGQTGPATVVLKLPSTEPRVRQMAVSHGIYGREVGLYRDLAFRGGVPAPACYWCAIDPGPERFGILLPDLGELASEDELCGISEARLATTIAGLADMHAYWWGSPELSTYDWLPPGNSVPLHEVVERCRRLWPQFLGRFGPVLPEGSLRFGGDAWAGAVHAAIEDMALRPATLVHGSSRLDNLFFAGRPEQVVAIDWQKCSRTVGVMDVAYLLTQSASVELRRAHEWDALRAWHDRVSSRVKSAYSYQDAVADYRRSVLFWMLAPLTWCDRYELATARGQQLLATRRHRTFTAAIDLCLEELLT